MFWYVLGFLLSVFSASPFAEGESLRSVWLVEVEHECKGSNLPAEQKLTLFNGLGAHALRTYVASSSADFQT